MEGDFSKQTEEIIAIYGEKDNAKVLSSIFNLKTINKYDLFIINNRHVNMEVQCSRHFILSLTNCQSEPLTFLSLVCH